MPHRYLLPSAVAVWICAANIADAAIIIDTFETPQTAAVIPSLFVNTPTSIASGAGILGGERDFDLTLVSGQGASLQSDFGDSGMLEYGQLGVATANALVAWDGDDGDASTLDPTGLGGIDLTAGGTLSGIALGVTVNDLAAPLVLTAYTDAGNVSTATINLPGGIPPGPPTILFVAFTDFIASLGLGADFTNIGAFTLFIDGSNVAGLDLQLNFIAATNPVPEPGTITLAGMGLVLVFGGSRMRARIRRLRTKLNDKIAA